MTIVAADRDRKRACGRHRRCKRRGLAAGVVDPQQRDVGRVVAPSVGGGRASAIGETDRDVTLLRQRLIGPTVNSYYPNVKQIKLREITRMAPEMNLIWSPPSSFTL